MGLFPISTPRSVSALEFGLSFVLLLKRSSFEAGGSCCHPVPGRRKLVKRYTYFGAGEEFKMFFKNRFDTLALYFEILQSRRCSEFT